MIVLNYNTSQAVITLYQQISALRAGNTDGLVYLVVDNASKPGETALLKNFFAGRSDVHLVLSQTNGGYARGNNLGLKKAAELGLHHCLIANSDIAFLTVDFLETLVAAARTLPACGLIGPRVVLPNGQAQGPLPETGVLNAVLPLPVAKCATCQPVYATVGCCIFGATSVFQKIGLLDEATFLYREEIVLAEKLRAAGLLWYYLPDVIVRHDHLRKTSSIRRILLHKGFEADSTIYYFRHYKHRSALAVLVYRVLLAAKTGILVALAGVNNLRARRAVASP
jgi:GT2 family glycosyltransferase